MGNRNGDDSEGPTRIGEQRRPTAVRGDASTEPAREVERDAGVQSAQRVTESGASTPAGSIAALARALASGVIDAAHAQAELIDRLVREQLPADASPALIESVRDEVATLLDGDPTLERLLRVST
ncbi:MAG: hypothetical protein KC636_07885 [Myxococcales bacterium]|nr:hypothetical protein [Myxococcales bacterium]